MRRTLNFLLLFLLSAMTVVVIPGDLQERLATLKGISGIERLQSDYYPEKYITRTTQQVDPKDPAAGTFTQRVIIGHVGCDRPIIIATEGYGTVYTLNPKHQEELSKLLNASLVFVEYRYFLESTPESRSWDYLAAEDSTYDLHNARNTSRQIYPEKWISTGISKGEQITMFYRAFFPDDVGFSVPYISPLYRSVESGRHKPFLRKIGTKTEHEKIQDFQLEVLKHKSDMLSLLESYCKNKNPTFRIPASEVSDYCVLKYSFTLRQWGASVSMIPSKPVDDQAPLDHLMEISGSDYFAKNQPNIPFPAQATRGLGYYDYDVKPFKKYPTIDSAYGYLNRTMLPEELVSKVDFRPVLYHKTYNSLEDNDPKMIFTYGEIDPWSAATVPAFKGKKNKQIYTQPRDSHRARIGNIPKDMKERILIQMSRQLVE